MRLELGYLGLCFGKIYYLLLDDQTVQGFQAFHQNLSKMFSSSFFTTYSEKGNCCMMEWALMISFDNGLCINIDIQDVSLNIFLHLIQKYSFGVSPAD